MVSITIVRSVARVSISTGAMRRFLAAAALAALMPHLANPAAAHPVPGSARILGHSCPSIAEIAIKLCGLSGKARFSTDFYEEPLNAANVTGPTVRVSDAAPALVPDAASEAGPPGSVVRFRDREGSVEYRGRAVLFAAGMLLQSVLIAWLLYADFRRRKAEEDAALLASELMHSNRLAIAGQLTASIAHEIRQPLAAIVSSANAGLNWLKHSPPDLDEARDAFENVVGQGHRADDVIKHMRGMFRKEPADRTRCCVNELIREVLQLAGGRIAAGEVKLFTVFAEPSPAVLADGVQLQQLILNLIINAVEAMIHVPPGRRALHVTTNVANGQALIAVEDTGLGMNDKTLERIFDPFFTTKTGGMGMGLSICRSIVEAHGGSLTASSAAGRGATFRIVMPLHKGAKS